MSLNKILSRKESDDVRIGDVIDIDAQLTSFKKNKLDMIKATNLYNSGNLSKAKIFRHYSKRLVSCTQEDGTIRLNLEKVSYSKGYFFPL